MSLNIFQRINEVRKVIAYIQKDRTVQTYKAVSHDYVVAVCREHMVAQGIIVYPEQVSGLMNPQGIKAAKDGSGTVPDPMRLYEGGYKIHFVNADDPQDRLTVAIEAHANDNGDKAPGKAVTYATKTALLKVLMLETGENDESRAPGTIERATFEQLTEISGLLESTKSDKPKFLEWLGVEGMGDITPGHYTQAVKMLKQKSAKTAKAE